MMPKAWELRFGSTWIMSFIPEAIKEEFDLPESDIPVCILVMGYPSQEPSYAKTNFQLSKHS